MSLTIGRFCILRKLPSSLLFSAWHLEMLVQLDYNIENLSERIVSI